MLNKPPPSQIKNEEVIEPLIFTLEFI